MGGSAPVEKQRGLREEGAASIGHEVEKVKRTVAHEELVDFVADAVERGEDNGDDELNRKGLALAGTVNADGHKRTQSTEDRQVPQLVDGRKRHVHGNRLRLRRQIEYPRAIQRGEEVVACFHNGVPVFDFTSSVLTVRGGSRTSFKPVLRGQIQAKMATLLRARATCTCHAPCATISHRLVANRAPIDWPDALGVVLGVLGEAHKRGVL